jgi:hypothetical protein
MATPPYVPYEGDLNNGYIVTQSDWNGMFDGIATYINNVLIPAIASGCVITPPVNQGRLYLTSGSPYADNASSSNLYFGPCPNLGNQIAIQNNAGTLSLQTFSETFLALGGLTANLPYDVYVTSLTSTTVGLQVVAWTNATTPPTRGVDVAGRPCKNGNAQALWVGAFVATSSTTTQNNPGARYAWNVYNRFQVTVSAVDATASWTTTSTTPVAANGNTTNGTGRFAILSGNGTDTISMVNQTCAYSSTTTQLWGAIGVNSATVATVEAGNQPYTASSLVALSVGYSVQAPLGINYYQRLNWGGAGTSTFIGGVAGGMYGTWWC